MRDEGDEDWRVDENSEVTTIRWVYPTLLLRRGTVKAGQRDNDRGARGGWS